MAVKKRTARPAHTQLKPSPEPESPSHAVQFLHSKERQDDLAKFAASVVNLHHMRAFEIGIPKSEEITDTVTDTMLRAIEAFLAIVGREVPECIIMAAIECAVETARWEMFYCAKKVSLLPPGQMATFHIRRRRDKLGRSISSKMHE